MYKSSSVEGIPVVFDVAPICLSQGMPREGRIRIVTCRPVEHCTPHWASALHCPIAAPCKPVIQGFALRIALDLIIANVYLNLGGGHRGAAVGGAGEAVRGGVGPQQGRWRGGDRPQHGAVRHVWHCGLRPPW